MQFLAVKSLPKMTGRVWLVQTINFCVKERPLMKKVHSVNPIGSILDPVAVTTRGNLSFVRLSLSESKVLRLMQLMEAPVSYSAFIFKLLQLIGKTVPVAGPTAMVQVSIKCVFVLFTSV